MDKSGMEMTITVIKEGIIRPTLVSAYAFMDAWSYLFFGQHPEHLNKRGIYEFMKPSYGSANTLRRTNYVHPLRDTGRKEREDDES